MSEPYTPRKCLACNKSQKEIHECLKHIHDPSNPDTYCFRGPNHINPKEIHEALVKSGATTKDIQEALIKYSKAHKGNPTTTRDVDHPSNPHQQPHLLVSKVNKGVFGAEQMNEDDSLQCGEPWMSEGIPINEWMNDKYKNGTCHTSNDSTTVPPIVNSTHRTPYTPTRCTVCGKTQKEIHEMLKQIHDPSDPDNCCFRGPKYIKDKDIRETVMQYNLKQTRVTSNNSHTGDKQPSTSLPDPKINKTDFQPLTDDDKKLNKVIEELTTPNINDETFHEGYMENRTVSQAQDEYNLTSMEIMIKQLEDKITTNEEEFLEHITPKITLANMSLQEVLPKLEFHMRKVEFPSTNQHIIQKEGEDLKPITPKQHTTMRL